MALIFINTKANKYIAIDSDTDGDLTYRGISRTLGDIDEVWRCPDGGGDATFRDEVVEGADLIYKS